jgi:NAD(P)-dependent dehydrogenase (short-subunit alcohol dehydrogenase family)
MAGIEGKAVLITGAASGIGAETARQLVERGATVALVDLRGDQVGDVAQRLGERAIPFTADVRDPETLEAIAQEVETRVGSLDVVVANAGIAHLETFTANDPANFERTIEVNLIGPWHTTRATLPQLRRSQGYLLVVASVAAAMHPPMMGAYAASKAGVEALANVMRIELEADGIDVGVGYFPWIDTPMVRDAFADDIGAKFWPRFAYPLNRRIPVEKAGAVMAAGIERRARRVYTPRWVRGMLLGRAALPRAIESQMRRAHVEELVREFEAGQGETAERTPETPVTSA